jgi:type II secretory pathway pseudopilin PulG
MVVVVLVAILTALAIPSLLGARADRVPAAHATRLSLLIRSARARAIDRGAAVMVAMSTDGATNRGNFSEWEAVGPNPGTTGGAGKGANRLPLSTCRGLHWDNDLSSNTTRNVATNNGFGMQFVDGLKLGGGIDDDNDVRTLIAGATTGTQCLCFSPSGRAYADATCTQPTGSSGSAVYKPAAGPQFQALTSNQGINVTIQRGTTPIGLRRMVMIPPSGATRVVATP